MNLLLYPHPTPPKKKFLYLMLCSNCYNRHISYFISHSFAFLFLCMNWFILQLINASLSCHILAFTYQKCTYLSHNFWKSPLILFERFSRLCLTHDRFEFSVSKWLQKRVSAERCAQLTIIAASHGLKEVWISYQVSSFLLFSEFGWSILLIFTLQDVNEARLQICVCLHE